MGQQQSKQTYPNYRDAISLEEHQTKYTGSYTVQHQVTANEPLQRYQMECGSGKSDIRSPGSSCQVGSKPRRLSLLDLPVEIRRMIWNELLTFDIPVRAGLVMNPLEFDQKSLDFLCDIRRRLYFACNRFGEKDSRVSCAWLQPNARSQSTNHQFLPHTHSTSLEPKSIDTLRLYLGATSSSRRAWIHSSAHWEKTTVQAEKVKGLELADEDQEDVDRPADIQRENLQAAEKVLSDCDTRYILPPSFDLIGQALEEYLGQKGKEFGKLGRMGHYFNFLMPATVRFSIYSDHREEDVRVSRPYMLSEEIRNDDQHLAILNTCLSIRHEAAQCFLQNNVFFLEDVEVGVAFFANFPAKFLAHIRHIHFWGRGFFAQTKRKFEERFDTAWNIFLWFLQQPGISIKTIRVSQPPSVFLSDFQFTQVLLGAGIESVFWLWVPFDKDRNKHRKLAERARKLSMKGNVLMGQIFNEDTQTLLLAMKGVFSLLLGETVTD